jgi:hypothetical protein
LLRAVRRMTDIAPEFKGERSDADIHHYCAAQASTQKRVFEFA